MSPRGGALVLNYAFENKDRVDGIILIDASGGVSTPPEDLQALMEQKQGEPWFAQAAEYFTRQPGSFFSGIRDFLPALDYPCPELLRGNGAENGN